MTLSEYLERKQAIHKKIEETKVLRKEWLEEYSNSPKSTRKRKNYEKALEDFKNATRSMLDLYDEFYNTK